VKLKIFPGPWRLLAIGVVYFAVMFFGHLPDHLILFPTTAPIDADGAVRRMLPFQNGQLEVWTAKSRLAQQKGGADIYVLRFYGNADRADRWAAAEAEMWNDRAVEIWGMNYPGFGGSTGPARLSLIGPAALTAFDELKRHAADWPVVVFGTSIGATPALHVAAHRRVAGLILHNPVPLREIILRRFGWWNLWLLAGPVALQIPPDLDSISNAKAIHAPAIFLLAEQDEVIPPRYHKLVVDAYAGEKRVIPLRGAYHNDPIEGDGLADFYRALDWLLPRTNSSHPR
jgi:alpha-beta hydrolase superfamily lysophospholipase